jgi:hypothetical protein
MERVLGTREPERRQAARREAVAVAPTEMLCVDVSEIPGETERWGEIPSRRRVRLDEITKQSQSADRALRARCRSVGRRDETSSARDALEGRVPAFEFLLVRLQAGSCAYVDEYGEEREASYACHRCGDNSRGR